MDIPEYEYYGLMAAAWDLLRGDTSQWPDRTFYLDVIQASGEPVLDVGCGTGRLLLDYLQHGLDIDGVDNSPEMLAICRQKAEGLGLDPRLYFSTMQALDLPRRYRTILVPSSSFQLLVVPEDVGTALQRFRHHLMPGGALAMSFYIPEAAEAAGSTTLEDWEVIQEAVRPEDGATVRRWARIEYDLVEKLEHTEDRYEVLLDGEIIDTEYHHWSPATRWYSLAEALNLFAQAGYVDIQATSRFSQEPAGPDDRLFCVVAHAPAVESVHPD
jgi:ubiquinone/menaquinone biosynthesis C-methylase UbiE